MSVLLNDKERHEASELCELMDSHFMNLFYNLRSNAVEIDDFLVMRKLALDEMVQLNLTGKQPVLVVGREVSNFINARHIVSQSNFMRDKVLICYYVDYNNLRLPVAVKAYTLDIDLENLNVNSGY